MAANLDRHTADIHPTGAEVESVEPKANALVPPQACASTQSDYPGVPLWDSREQLPNERLAADGLVVGGTTPDRWQADPLARIEPDDPIPHRQSQHRRQQTVSLVHGLSRPPGRELGDPGLD
jgi:hypothetical protein